MNWMVADLVADSLCLMVRIEEDGSQRIFGSGFFFMDNDVVATAKHILQDIEDSKTHCYLGVFTKEVPELLQPIQCVYHSEQDLAFIKLNKPNSNVQPLQPGYKTEAGFIYAAYDPIANRTFVARVPAFMTPPGRETNNSVTHFFEWNTPTMPGNSGGPLVGTDGGVVGILSGVVRRGSSANCEGHRDPTAQGIARAVFIGPLVDLYRRWKFFPGMIREDFTPFR